MNNKQDKILKNAKHRKIPKQTAVLTTDVTVVELLCG